MRRCLEAGTYRIYLFRSSMFYIALGFIKTSNVFKFRNQTMKQCYLNHKLNDPFLSFGFKRCTKRDCDKNICYLSYVRIGLSKFLVFHYYCMRARTCFFLYVPTRYCLNHCAGVIMVHVVKRTGS